MNQTAQSWWFIFYKDQLLLEKKEDGIYTVPCGESSPIVIKEKTTVHNITTLERKNCKAFSLSSPIEESEQWIMIGLRAPMNIFLCLIIRQQEKHMRFCIGIETAAFVPPAARLWNRKNLS